jgi:hypothetical protein
MAVTAVPRGCDYTKPVSIRDGWAGISSSGGFAMTAKRFVLTAGAAMLWSGVAAADVLYSPPLVAEGRNLLDCYLVNVSRGSRWVTIEVLNREGQVVEKVGTTLGPGKEDVARTEAADGGRVCRFTVQGSARDYRGSILVRSGGVGAISALPAF